jgi:hypothetical protein
VKEVVAALEHCTGYTTSGLTPGFLDYERSEEDKQWVMYHQRDRLWGAKAGSLKAAVRGTTYINPVSCRVDAVEMKEVFGAAEAAAVAATTAAAEGGYTHTGVTRSQRQVKTIYSSLAGLDGPSGADGTSSSTKAAKIKVPKVPKFDEVPSAPQAAAPKSAAAGTYPQNHHHHQQQQQQQQQRKVPSAPSSAAGAKRDRQGVALVAGVTRPGATGAAGHLRPTGRPAAQMVQPIHGPQVAAAAAAAQQQVVPNPHHMVAADHAVQESALKKIRTGAYSPAPQANSRSVSPAPGTPLGDGSYSNLANNLGGSSPAPSRSPSVGYYGGSSGNGYQQHQQQQQGPMLLPSVSLPTQSATGMRIPHVSLQQQQYQQGGMGSALLVLPANGTGFPHNPLQDQQQQAYYLLHLQNHQQQFRSELQQQQQQCHMQQYY